MRHDVSVERHNELTVRGAQITGHNLEIGGQMDFLVGTGCNEHPRGQLRAIFNKLEAEIDGEGKTYCPLGTHVAG